MIECYMDNCPHHSAKHVPEKYWEGPFCNLDKCAWDEPTMTKYFEAVATGEHFPEKHLKVLPIEEEESCENSEERNT